MNKMIVATVVALVSVLGLADTHAKKAAKTVSSNVAPVKVASTRTETGTKGPRPVGTRAKKQAARSVSVDSIWKVEKLAMPPCVDAWWVDASGESVTNAAGESATCEWYMSEVFEEEAQMAIARLDCHYGRCPVELLETLVGWLFREPGDKDFWERICLLDRNGRPVKAGERAHLTWQGWRLTDRFYFLIEGEEACCIRGRYYRFVFFDGVTARAGTTFEEFPTPQQAKASLRALQPPKARRKSVSRP